MKNKIFLIILLFISAGYNTNAQEVTKQDSTKNEHHSDLKLFPLNNDKIRDAYKSNINLLERVKEDILDRKTFDFLVNNSKITTNKIDMD